MDVRRWIGYGVVVASLLTIVGCGGSNDAAPPGPQSSLLTDGRVPWVDDPLTSVHPAPTTPTARPGSKPCTAAQLSGQLDRWWIPKPGAGGSDGVVLAPEGANTVE